MTDAHRPPRRRTIRKVNYWRLGLVIGILLAVIGAASAAGLVIYGLRDMPAWNPKPLQTNMPSYIYDKDGNLINKIYVENRDPIDIEQVPDLVKSAFLSIEDTRFYEHKGLDLRRIVGATIADIKSGSRAQGASTITQQVVKMAFLSPEKTFKRKIQEAMLAIQLERNYPKDDIFEMYLNRIYFGEGAYGIKSAAMVYFGKDNLEKLNLEEAALLAGLPKAPNNYDPFKDLEAATRRRNIVLTTMVRNDFISEDQAAAASAKPVSLVNDGKSRHVEKYKFPYFVDYITDLLIEKYGETQVYKGGLHVYTTVDPKVQTAAERALADPKNFPKAKYDKKGVIQPQAAVVVLDPHTGYIKAIVGGREHKQKRQFNRATDAVRQPGSTFKPVVAYGPALERGKSPSDVVNDVPTKYGTWPVRNYDGKYRGYITYRTATMFSVNVAAVKIMEETGVQKSIEFAKKLGITSLVKGEDEHLSTALGGITRGVKPLELASAYGAFANEGVYIQPTAITRIEDRDHNIIEEVRPKKTIAMKKTTAFLMTSMLESAVKGGTGYAASLGKRPVAGKTGTTSDDKDAWFAGYTPELVSVVWMGHDTPTTMPRVYGGTYPAKIWKSVMKEAHKNLPVKEFPKPKDIVYATVCSESGNKPSELCPEDSLVKDVFAKGSLPTKECDAHVLVEVCSESDQLPTSACPSVVKKSFLKGKEPVDTCKIHPDYNSGNNSGTATVPVCTDPIHSEAHLAIVPGPSEDGGCPPEVIQYISYPPGEMPSKVCDIPEHQKTKKPVQNNRYRGRNYNRY